MLLLTLLLALQDPRVPDGFTIEKVSGPEVQFPMFGTFDDRGRLYVTESSGGDLYLELQKLTPSSRIRVFEDRDGDGKFETSRVFAEGLRPSMGLAWRGGKLYAADPPDLVTLENTDGDGKADKRTVVLTGFGHKDNGSLHGLTFGPDDLLYFTMGDPDSYKLRGPDGSTAEGTTGALIRCKPDGSKLEVLCTGFENLVEIVILPTGDIIGTDNWFQLPAGGIRDALVHLVPGGVYPRHHESKHAPLIRTGDPLPAVALFPAVALSGLVRYSGSTFPKEYGALFSAQHNSRKVQRHDLQRTGATYSTKDCDFVTSESPDFHPSDVLEAPDGSLLVIDTGSWYTHHCPTGKIRGTKAPGGIFRVRSTISRPEAEKHAIKQMEMVWSDRWKSSFTPGPEALKELLWLLDNGEPKLAAHALARRGDPAAGAPLAEWLSDRLEPSPYTLAVAEALATCGTPASLPALWRTLERNIDRHLEHAIVYAIHKIADRAALEAALKSPHPRVQKAALLLLDQAPHKALSHEPVVARVTAEDPELRRTALWILQRHADWAPHVLSLLEGWLKKTTLTEEERRGLQSSILAFQSNTGIQKLSADAVFGNHALLMLETIAQTTLKEVPRAWRDAVAKALEPGDPAVRQQAARAAAVLQLKPLDDQLSKIADAAAEPAALRVEALRAVILRKPTLSGTALDLLLARLADRKDPLARLAAAEVLGRAKLTDDQKRRVAEATGDDPLLARKTSVDPTRLRARLAELEPLLDGGDAARGRAVFASPKVACVNCHRVGNDGGQVGPDLTKVGAIRAGRDLLESIVAPSSTFAQGYEPLVVATHDGDVVTGLVARQTEEMLVLRDAGGGEIRLRKDRIREMKRAELSVMPEGLDGALTADELRDLLAFLRSLK